MYSEIMDGGQPHRRVEPRFQEPMFASQASTHPEAMAGGAPTWDAKNPLTTNFTVNSRERAGASLGADGAKAAEPNHAAGRTYQLQNSLK